MELIRRDFLKASALAGGAIAAAGLMQSVGNQAIAEQPAGLTDGDYITSAMSMHGPITVCTSILGGRIADVKVLRHHESFVVGEYAVQTMPARIVESQCLDADVATGATISSYAILNAVADAVVKAGGDPAAFEGYAAPEPVASEQTREADVAIMGGGTSGLMAALALAEAGKSVVIFEKMPYVGGTIPLTSCGVYTVESQLQKNWGLDHVAAYYSYLDKRLDVYRGRLSGRYVNDEVPFIRSIFVNGSAAVDKLMELDVPFACMGNESVPTFAPATFGDGGKTCVQILKHKLVDLLGVEIITEAPVTSLIMDGNKVAGFEAQGVDGTHYTVSAKAVILASGGYISNPKMMAEYQPDDLQFPLGGMPWATGEGMLMARDQAGAAWCCMDCGVTSHYHAGVSMAEISFAQYCASPYILVNGTGKRFVDENTNYLVACKLFKDQPTTDFYLVFDEVGSYGLYETNNAYRIDYSWLFQTGDIIEGENLADLAQKTGMADLVATCEAVNRGEDELSDNDEAFAKRMGVTDQKGCFNTNGKMYALKIIPSPYVAQGGLLVDENCHVQREDGSIIEGLYAAGDITGALENRDGHYYTMGLVQGLGLGKLAGEVAAAEI